MRRLLTILSALSIPMAASAATVDTSERAAQSNPEVFGMKIDTVQAGGGYSNYTAGPQIAPGYGWDVRMSLDASEPVDIEASYVGAYNSLYDIPDAPDNPFNIYTNGLQLAAKIDPITLDNPIAPVRPFVVAGIGLTRLSVANDPRLATQFRSDTAGAVPLAAGVDVQVTDNFEVTGRGQYDLLFDNEIKPLQDKTSSDRLAFTLNVGLTQF